MAKITVAKLFETVAEVDKRSQVALMQSEDSIQISEKTRTDLERLIATLRTDFTDSEQTQEIIRADKEEDNTITSSFFELQKSFDGLVGTVDILRTDLDNLYQAFYTSQIVRQEQLEKEEDAVFKEQDDLQKKRGERKEGKGVLSNMIKGKKDPNQIQQDRKKQEKSLTKSILRTLGLGALASAAMGFGASDVFGGYGDTYEEQQGTAPFSLDASKVVADSVEAKAFIATVRETEGTAAESGYNTVYGGAVVPELTQMTLGELYEAIKLGGTDRLPARLGGGIIPFKKDKYNSSASGALQLMPETLKGMLDRGEFKEDDIFSPETQNKMIIQLAVNGGIDLENITPAELDKASGIWAGLSGAVYGQTTRTGEDSYRIYQQNVREAELGRFTTPDEPTKEEALRKIDETLKEAGMPGLPREEEKEVKPQPQSQGNFLDFMMKSVFPDQYNQSLYTPAREDRQIASLQSNRSPNVSVVNLTQGMDGGTQVQQPRGSARSSVIPLSNTANLSPVSLMTQNTFLT